MSFLKKFLLGTVLLSLVAFTGVAAFLWQSGTVKKVVRVIQDPGKAAFGEQRFKNILVLGVDYNYDRKAQRHTKGVRSDTILVLRVDRWGHSLSMLSVPRDLLVEISPVHGRSKINDAFAYGGVEQAKSTISGFLEVPIHQYVLVKVDAATKMVDILEGVEVDVEKSMHYDDNWANFHVHLEPGVQVLNGEQAVGYCRFRNDEEGDFGRIRRQQQFLTALLKKLKGVRSLPRIKKLAELFRENFETDLTVEQLAGLGNLYRDFTLSRVEKGSIPCSDLWLGGISYLQPDYLRTRELVRKLFERLTDPTLAELSTEVLNACQSRESTATTIQSLQKAGFNVIRSRPVNTRTVAKTYAVLRTEHENAETQLKSFFPDIEVRKEEKGPKAPDLTVWVGVDPLQEDQSDLTRW